MRFELSAETDLAAFAVFDPHAIEGIAKETLERLVSDRAVANEVAKRGTLVPLAVPSDGGARFLVLVDEGLGDIDPALQPIGGGRVRFTSGEVAVSGLEYVAEHRASQRGRGEAHGGQWHASGTYNIELLGRDEVADMPSGLLPAIGCLLWLVGGAAAMAAIVLAAFWRWEALVVVALFAAALAVKLARFGTPTESAGPDFVVLLRTVAE